MECFPTRKRLVSQLVIGWRQPWAGDRCDPPGARRGAGAAGRARGVFRAISPARRRQRLDRRIGRGRAAARRDASCANPGAGLRRGVLRGPDGVPTASSSASWTATGRLTRTSSRRGRAGRRGHARSLPRRAGAGGPRRVAVARAARQPRCSRSSCAGAPSSPLRDLGPMRCARREALLALGLEGPRVRLAAGDGVCAPPRAGWRVGEVPSLPGAGGRDLEGERRVRGSCARDPRHGRAAAVSSAGSPADAGRSSALARARGALEQPPPGPFRRASGAARSAGRG